MVPGFASNSVPLSGIVLAIRAPFRSIPADVFRLQLVKIHPRRDEIFHQLLVAEVPDARGRRADWKANGRVDEPTLFGVTQLWERRMVTSELNPVTLGIR